MPSDDDFCSPKPPIPFPAAPRRPEKKGDVQSIPIVSVTGSSLYSEFCGGVKNDTTFGSDTKPSECCAVCSKNLSHLNDIRKVAHVNKCLDAQESSVNHAKAKEVWNNTIDCPLCGEPQPPGPHRSAHAKRCGKTYNIAPKELLRLMETQRRVSDVKKRHSMIHTKAPVPQKKEVKPPKLEGAPNSLLDENIQLAKALSASMNSQQSDNAQDTSPQVTRIIDTNDKRRKRPRSYAVVELAPRSCRCEVIQKVQNRFLETFRVRKITGAVLPQSEISKKRATRTSIFMQNQIRLLQKVERLERLSQDLNRLVGQGEKSDVHIRCSDGNIDAHQLLLKLRTRLLDSSPSQNGIVSAELCESQKIVMMWLRYVYSGRIEWNVEETESILKLAEQYGPDDLPSVCIRMRTPQKAEESAASQSSTSECSPGSSCTKIEAESASSIVTSSEPKASPPPKPNQPSISKTEVIIPEELKVNLRESSATADTTDITLDYEDPLQGITLDQSSAEPSLEDDCVIIDGSPKKAKSSDLPASCGSIEEASQSQSQSSKLSEGKVQKGADVSSSSAEDIHLSSNSHEGDSTPSSIPNEEDASQPSTSSRNSPDLFDEKSRDAREASLITLDTTPLRSCSLRKRSSAVRVSLNHELSEFSPGRNSPKIGSADCNKPMETSPIRMNTTGGSGSIDNDIVCLGEQPGTQTSMTSSDPYRNEYFDYHDPFMEPWYDPVEMQPSQACSEPVTEAEPVGEDIEATPSHGTSRRRSSRTERKSLTQIPMRPCSSTLERAEPTIQKIYAASQDSFFDTPIFLNKEAGALEDDSGNCEVTDFVQSMSQQTTPVQPVKKKPRFGSNVKILKTSGITPVPNYDGMGNDELKRELAKFGLKPMGRKRAIAILKKIYSEVHPVIDPSTPTIRPLVVDQKADGTPISSRNAKSKIQRKRGNVVTVAKETVTISTEEPSISNNRLGSVDDDEDDDFADLGDKTLNEPRDEPLEESMIDDTGLLPKDLDGMTDVFLKWLRQPANDDLYNHLLSLQPVLIEELHQRMSRADTAACVIPRKALANILDRLGVTFSMPQVYGRTKARK
ncbi:hypothetical protein V3C99_000279 [Haemonchus contortus]